MGANCGMCLPYCENPVQYAPSVLDPNRPEAGRFRTSSQPDQGKDSAEAFGILPAALKNIMVSSFCWFLALMLSLPSLWYYGNTAMLMLLAVAGFVLYVLVYSIVGRLQNVTRDTSRAE